MQPAVRTWLKAAGAKGKREILLPLYFALRKAERRPPHRLCSGKWSGGVVRCVTGVVAGGTSPIGIGGVRSKLPARSLRVYSGYTHSYLKLLRAHRVLHIPPLDDTSSASRVQHRPIVRNSQSLNQVQTPNLTGPVGEFNNSAERDRLFSLVHGRPPIRSAPFIMNRPERRACADRL